MGKLVMRKKAPGFAWLVFSMTAGLLVIYAVGIAQLSFVAKLPLEKALAVGVLPFLPGDVLKIIAAAMITLKTRDKVRL
jgi:biotin transport system substrate-specific component